MTVEINQIVQLIVFDMAGTTVKDENEVQQCFLIAADQTGLDATPDVVNFMMGWAKKQAFRTLWQTQVGTDHPEYDQKVETSYLAFQEALEHHYRTQPIHPTESCLEIFDWLKSQGIAIALNTGFYRKVTDIILDRLGWNEGLNPQHISIADSRIQISVTPSEIYNHEGRPAPYMIQKAMYSLGITNPQTVVTVGDTPSDLAAGLNAHCLMALGVTNGTHTREQLEQYPNHGLLGSLSELKGTLAHLCPPPRYF